MPPAPSPGAHGAATPPSKPQSPLRITHEGEFYARLLTRESSLGNPSFRYYGAGTGAVPFVWESQPGTPKDAYSCRMLAAAAAVAPVITPPPSYYLHGVPLGRANRRHGKTTGGYKYKQLKWVKLSFIATVFRRLAFGNKSRPSAAAAEAAVKSSSSSSSSSARWLFSGSSAAEARDQECCGYDDPAPAAAEPRTKGAVLCLGVRATPWMLQFCGGQREQAGWVYGWRP